MKKHVIKFTQILLFFLAFTIEVEVSAESFASIPLQAEPILYPPNCVVGSNSCGYKTYPTRRYLLKLSQGELTLGSDTIVLRKELSQYALVNGTVMFVGTNNFVIETPMGTIKTTSERTEVIVEKVDKSYNIKVISGSVEVLPSGSKKPVQVLAAYENQISGVSSTGVATTAFPKPIDVNSFLQSWASLYNGDKHQFKNAVSEFKNSHSKAVEEISEVYTETSKREIASYQHEMKLREERRKKEMQERAFIRRLFERRLRGIE